MPRRLRVLVVDDNTDMVKSLALVLESVARISGFDHVLMKPITRLRCWG